MPTIVGTHLDVRFSRVIDGDTIRVFLPDQERDESLRILSLDTEESNAGGSKPVTPWGRAAKERTLEFFQGADVVTIEFPGHEDLPKCLQMYRGNFGRLLAYVYQDGVDFQETMIREGYSPYFVKYGDAVFPGHHQRYSHAERVAQRQHIGVWDQITVNGSERRNYAALGTWWQLRATIIDKYRKLRAQGANVLNTRLDYALLERKAQAGEHVTVFTELRSIIRVGGDNGLIGIGSNQQPFSLFIPDIDSPEGQTILHLLETRYISSSEDHPRRSYAYVSGALSTFRDRPQMVLTSVDQITDGIDAPSEVSETPEFGPIAVRIASLLPNPVGSDRGNERVTLRNTGTGAINLQGWVLRDRANHRVALEGILGAGQEKEIVLQPGQMPLNNLGDEVTLIDSDGTVQDEVTYTARDVVEGKPIQF